MTGDKIGQNSAQHYAEAERLIEEGLNADWDGITEDIRHRLVLAGIGHAILATVKAGTTLTSKPAIIKVAEGPDVEVES